MEADPFEASVHGLKFQVTLWVVAWDDRIRDSVRLTDLDSPVIGENLGMRFGQSSKLLCQEELL